MNMRDRIHRAAAEPGSTPADDARNIEMILDLPLTVSVRLGQTKILIQDLLRLDKNSVIQLDQSSDAPLDIVVNDKVLARGEVVVMDERLGIRITDILSRRERVESLS
jgi:flagellar motor switch protein FliN/FliY